MKPLDLFNALMEGKTVKVTDKKLKELEEDVNSFLIHQIEQGCVNLFSKDSGEVYYDVDFSDVIS